MTWRLIPVAIAFLLLGAHFLRADIPSLVLLCLGAPFLLLVARRWALRTVQVALWCGAGVWAFTGLSIGRDRLAAGQPWLRMALILGAVALFTAFAGLLLNARSVKARYN